MSRRRSVHGVWLGRRRYEPVHALQQALQRARQERAIGDTVLLLEHDPVITLGRGAHPENILAPRELLEAARVDLVETGRGGDVTLHAPGQLVCYPIVDLSPDRCDVRRYVGDLMETMRGLARRHGIDAGPVPELIGLWVDRSNLDHFSAQADALALAKLGAIGVKISRWVTLHGFAFNLTTDLELYGMIVPCGIREHGVTSVEALTGARPPVVDEAEPALELLAQRLDAHVASYDDWSGEAELEAKFGLDSPRLAHSE